MAKTKILRRKAPAAPARARARASAGAKKPVSEIVASATPDQRRTWMDALGSQPAPLAGSIDQASIVPAMYAAWGAYGYQPAITWYQLANMFTSWEYTATEKIARTIAGLPAKLYRYENSQGKTLKPHYVKSLIFDDQRQHKSALMIQRKLKKEHGIRRFEIDDHPFLDLVAMPNNDMVRFNFWRLLCIHLELNGAVGVYKAMQDGFGNPQQLHILPTTWTGQLKPMPATDGINLIKGYMLLDQDLHTIFSRDEIMWIHYTSLRNPFEGMSAIKAQLYAFNMDQYLMQQISAYYKNGAMFSNVFKTDQQLTQDQYNSIACQLQNYAGAKNAGQKFILHSGLDMVNNTTTTAREAMIDEIENMARDKLLSAHDVSAGKIGLVASQNRSNLDTVDMGFFNESIKPRAMLITEYFDRYIVNNYDPNIDFEFDYPHFQDRQMDISERSANINLGLTSRNEERDKMGLEPVEGGDVILVSPMNAPLRDVANPPPPQEPAPAPAPASGAPAGGDGDEGEDEPAAAEKAMKCGEGSGRYPKGSGRYVVGSGRKEGTEFIKKNSAKISKEISAQFSGDAKRVASEAVRMVVKSDTAEGKILYLDSGKIGAVCSHKMENNVLNVEMLASSGKDIGIKGLGEEMMRDIAREATARGADGISLFAEHDAIGFYKAIGMQALEADSSYAGKYAGLGFVWSKEGAAKFAEGKAIVPEPESGVYVISKDADADSEDESASEKNYGFRWHHCRKVFWTPDKKALAWKKFDREAKVYEPLFKRVIVKFFRDMAAASQDLVEKHGVKIKCNIGAMSFNGRQKWLADHKDRLGELVPAKAEMKKRLKRDMQPVYYTVVDAAGKEQADEFLELLGKPPKVKAKVEGDGGDIEMEYGFEFNVNDPAVKEWIGERLEEFSEITAQTTIDATRAVLREDFENGEPLMKMGEHLREYYTDAETYRANLIARTEATSAMNKGDLEAVEQMGLGDAVGKVWLAEPAGTGTRPTHTEAGERYSDGYDSETGDPMTIDKEFSVGEDKMLHPAGGQLAEENCNCRCGLVYELLGDRGDRDMSDAADFGGEGEKTFEGHAGREGEVGGSLPEGSGRDCNFDESKGVFVDSKTGEPLPAHIKERGDKPIGKKWTDIRYNPDPEATTFATGRDSKGRVQSVHSKEFMAENKKADFARAWALNEKFPEINKEISADIRKGGENKEEAACLRLVANEGLRPGSMKDTGAEKQAYGATTLLPEHIKGDNASNVRLEFVGKKGVELDLPIHDKAIATDLLERRESTAKGEHVFQTNRDKLLDYAKSKGDDAGFKTKNFRTALATRVALGELKKYPKPSNKKEYVAAVKAVATTVSSRLGNTPAMAVKAYIHPSVWTEWSVK